MFPALAYEIVKARQADLRREAEQAALAGAARRARLAVTPPPASTAAGLARRALGMLAALARAAQARSRPSARCQPVVPCTDCA